MALLIFTMALSHRLRSRSEPGDSPNLQEQAFTSCSDILECPSWAHIFTYYEHGHALSNGTGGHFKSSF